MPEIQQFPKYEDGWPQHDANGYFVGESRDCGGPQPNNTAGKDDWPEVIPGFIPRRNGEPGDWRPGWSQVEDHRGEQGYIGSAPFTVTEPGPLPEGFGEFPEPSADEIDADARAYVQQQLAALQTEYLTPETIAGIAAGDEDAKALYAEYQEQSALWRERLAAVPATGEVAA